MMKKQLLLLFLIFHTSGMFAQTFTRSELPTSVSIPWEMVSGPDHMLWITESNGVVSRVDPETGNKTILYTANDYFGGSALETSTLCPSLHIGSGTMGLALHPDFGTAGFSYLYFMYSYNAGTSSAPDTRYKIRRLEWDPNTEQITGFLDIVSGISNGYDHLGGRLLSIKQNNIPYLFVSVGDHGASETNSPGCYNPESDNPNNFAQDPNTDNGKIHRFHMDGSIPADNPIPGNSFYTRGHRNPQGLVFNSDLNILYDIEHGDRTDDEINILEKGMNYGWKNVRGYHSDENFPGESDYFANYIPNPLIANDQLVDPIYSFCTEPTPSNPNGNSWCTVAPSDGIYYNSNAIPQWKNSILLVTLKDGDNTNMEVYRFKLTPQGTIDPGTSTHPNPQRFFGEDQLLNGRLRDIAVSPDGTKIYLINNGGGTANTSKITVYTYTGTPETANTELKIYPNPTSGNLQVMTPENNPYTIRIFDLKGARLLEVRSDTELINLDLSALSAGLYWVHYQSGTSKQVLKFVKQ